MKLVEILARELDVWPEDVVCCTQDRERTCTIWSADNVYCYGGYWFSEKGSRSLLEFKPLPHLAEDHTTAIVTKDMWQAERNKILSSTTKEDQWTPQVGDIVEYKNRDSIDYAYDSPERMEVVAIVGDKVWLKNALRDLVTNLDNISPLEKEKSLREELVEIMSFGGQQNYVDVYRAADRLIRAGIKLEGRE